MKEAMKARDELRVSVLRMLLAVIANREIEKKGKGVAPELTEEEVVAAIRSEAKKRRDAIEEFKKGGRKDLVEKELAELTILEFYLPPEMSEDELEKLAKEVVTSLGEVTPKDFGRAMGEVMKRVRGKASGNRVSNAVRKVLE